MSDIYAYESRQVDERQVDELNLRLSIHRKNMMPILENIKTMDYTIGDKYMCSLGETRCESTRILNNCKVVYIGHECGSTTVFNYSRAKFITNIPNSQPLGRGKYQVAVYTNESPVWGWTQILLHETHGKYLYEYDHSYDD